MKTVTEIKTAKLELEVKIADLVMAFIQDNPDVRVSNVHVDLHYFDVEEGTTAEANVEVDVTLTI